MQPKYGQAPSMMKTSTPSKPSRRIVAMPTLVLIASLAACVSPTTRPAARVAARAPMPAPLPRPAPYSPPSQTVMPVAVLPTPEPRGAVADPVLASRITALGRAFNGEVGIAVRDVHGGWTASWNGSALMPQQSVSKLWVAITLFDAIDKGTVRLSDPVDVTAADMTLFHQPIRGELRGGVFHTTVSDLLNRAMTQSDNTANDLLLRRVGGPGAVRAVLARAGVQRVRFGPGERLLQSGTAGLTWRPEYSIGNAFYAARSALPASVRQAALARYLADPVDGASADGITDGLAKLKRGEIVSSESAQRLISIMYGSKTGPQRMKSGTAPGWLIAHKTGTGQIYEGVSTGYNDVALVTAPDGSTYAVAILIGRTREEIPTRQQLMGNVIRALVDYKSRASYGSYAR